MQKFEKALEVQQKALEKYADELGDKASSADLTAQLLAHPLFRAARSRVRSTRQPSKRP